MTKAFTERLDEILHKLGDNGWHDNKGARVDCKSCKKLDQAKDQILALVADEISDLMGEIDTMPHYIRSKFAEHVETTEADDAEMLLADEVKIIIATQRKKLGI